MQACFHCVSRECIIQLFLLKKQEKMAVSENNYICSEDYLQDGFPKISSQCRISFIVLGLREWIFELFLLKTQHNSGENGHIGKKYKLVFFVETI